MATTHTRRESTISTHGRRKPIVERPEYRWECDTCSTTRKSDVAATRHEDDNPGHLMRHRYIRPGA
jgi:hypothetical protein